MGGFVSPPLREGGGGEATPPATSRCGSLLLSLPADVRSLDDVIAFEGTRALATRGQRCWSRHVLHIVLHAHALALARSLARTHTADQPSHHFPRVVGPALLFFRLRLLLMRSSCV